MRLTPLTMVMSWPCESLTLSSSGCSRPVGSLPIGLVVAHADRVGRVETDDAVIFDIDAGDAVARGGDEKAIVKADFQRAGFDVAVPIEIARAEAEVPLADNARLVAGRFERAGECRRAWWNDERGVAGQDAGARLSPGILAGEQGEARGGAGGGTAVGVGEAEPFAGDAVEVRRFDRRRAVAAEIAVADVVGVDEDNVGAIGLGGDGSPRRHNCSRGKKNCVTTAHEPHSVVRRWEN